MRCGPEEVVEADHVSECEAVTDLSCVILTEKETDTCCVTVDETDTEAERETLVALAVCSDVDEAVTLSVADADLATAVAVLVTDTESDVDTVGGPTLTETVLETVIVAEASGEIVGLSEFDDVLAGLQVSPELVSVSEIVDERG